MRLRDWCWLEPSRNTILAGSWLQGRTIAHEMTLSYKAVSQTGITGSAGDP